MSAYTQSYFYRKVYFSNSSVTTTPSSGVAVPGADETLTFSFYLVTLSEDCQENCVTMLVLIQPIRPYKFQICNTGLPVI